VAEIGHTTEIKAIQADMIRLTLAIDEFGQIFELHRKESHLSLAGFEEILIKIQAENVVKGVRLSSKVDKVDCLENRKRRLSWTEALKRIFCI